MPGYERDSKRFDDLDTQVLGISVDPVPALQGWQKSLGGIMYPLLSDFWPHGEVCKKYGVFFKNSGFSERVIFIIDKKGIIRYKDVIGIRNLPSNEPIFERLAEL